MTARGSVRLTGQGRTGAGPYCASFGWGVMGLRGGPYLRAWGVVDTVCEYKRAAIAGFELPWVDAGDGSFAWADGRRQFARVGWANSNGRRDSEGE